MRMNGKKDGVLMACYACLLLIGGLLTWLEYDYNAVKMEDVRDACGYVSASATPVEAPKIALTFDDGPSAAWTPVLLDGLKERGVKATFFLIGENADKNPEIVKRMAEEGHLIGNHTYHHVELTKVSENEARLELADTSAVIVRITGKEPEYMRPPFGAWQRKLEQEIEMLPVLWTIDPLDWTTENQDEIVNKVVTEAEENDIILLHDCYKSSVEAGLRIVDILQEEGFVFVTVDELLLN
ncbi:peptidoglycan N-acetylglucosamine deacetylase [Dorea sp. AM58-8]|nr:polysaccharide deacetylase family protein [Dorea sp. AM58-8]RGY79692.1 peptidoglycan N-acetylglucosamine deacetylase [Dorea sp. AM58-8]